MNDYWEEIHSKSYFFFFFFPVVFIVGNFSCNSCWSMEVSGKPCVEWLNLANL